MATVHLERVRPRRRRRRHGLWPLLLPWLVTWLILVATAVIAFWPREPELRAPAAGEGALVWGDGVFTNPLELEAWLRVRGVSYRQWARRHPAAVKLLVPELDGQKPAAPSAQRTEARTETSLTSRRSLALLGVLALLGAVLALVIARFGSYARTVGLRVALFGAATSLAIGVAVATLLA